MLKHFFIFLFFIAVSYSFGQRVSISGTVLDDQNQAAIGTSVMLLSVKDSSLIKGMAADVDGKFKLDNVLGNSTYILKFQLLGYETIYQPLDVLIDTVFLNPIIFTQLAKNLKEVQIEGKQVIATQQGDTTSFNANAFKVNKDANAEDLVTKMPGVTIVDGKVQAQGEDVKQVLVDGKLFFGDDAYAVLKNLPAEVIDKVQVFDKRSDQSLFTGFDDGSGQKTINIVTKTQFRNGVFGKAFAGYGYEDKYKMGGVLNYFKDAKRITVLVQTNNINEQNFSTDDLAGVMSSNGGNKGGGGRGQRGGGNGGNQGNSDNFLVNSSNGINKTTAIGLNYINKWGKKTDVTVSYFFNDGINNSNSSINQQYIVGSNNGLIYNETNNSFYDNINHRLNLKIETKLDSLNQITIQPKISFQNNTNNKYLLGNNTRFDTVLTVTQNQSNSNVISYNSSVPILFRHSFAKKGRTFSVNVTPTFVKNNGNGGYTIYNNYYTNSLASDTVNQTTQSYKNSNSATGAISYTEPLSKVSFLLFGYNASYTDNYSSKRNYNYNVFQNNYTQLDTSLSNEFGNNYQSHSGSLGYRYQKPKINFSLNAAYQWAQLKKDQIFPTTVYATKVFESVLPSAQFQYKFSAKKNLRLMYRTSNNAPSIDQLQNVVNNSNSLQLSTGNSDLKQDFQQMLNIRYSAVNTDKARSFFALLGGNYSSNYISNSTLIANQDTMVYGSIFLAKGSQIIRPVNVNNYYTLRSFINYTFPLTVIKTNFSINASVNYNNIPGLINEKLNEAKTASTSLGLVLSSNISEKFDFTMSSNSAYSNINNTLQSNFNATYFTQSSKVKLNANPWKGLILQTEFTNSIYSGLSASFNQSISLWNASIGYKFLKNKQADVRLIVYDLLNNNNNIQRINTDSYIQDSRTNTLNRYFMVMFTYNFKKYFETKTVEKNN